MHGGASGAVLAHSSACHVCGGDDTDEAEGEILLRCVECTASAHASCVGLDAAPDGGEWRCGKAMSGVCVRIGKPLVVAGAMSNAYDVGAMNNEDDDDDIAEHPSDDDYDEKNKSDSESESDFSEDEEAGEGGGGGESGEGESDGGYDPAAAARSAAPNPDRPCCP